MAVMRYPKSGRPTAKAPKEVVAYALEGSLEENATVIEATLNLRPPQEQVITLLGPAIQKCYLFGS